MPDVVSRSKVLAHLVDSVRATPLTTEPFHHLEIPAVFTPEGYAALMANLPETRFYGEIKHRDARLPDGRSARRKLELRAAHLRRLPEPQRGMWSAVASAMEAPELAAAYREKFSAALERRFGRRAREVMLHPAAMLLRDLGGYKISVHSDSPRKAITTQYYLPRDGAQAHLGTTFHTKTNDGVFAEVKTLPFAPNTGYAFPVAPESWHGVREMAAADGERNSLMLIYYVDQGWLGEAFNRAKRLAQDVQALCSPSRD